MKTAHRVAIVMLAASLPVAAMADKPAHAGKGNGNHVVIKKKHLAKAEHSERRLETVRKRGNDRVRYVQSASCPPGLAKKSPACIPPGQAKKLGVGQVIQRNNIHWVTRPGLYGLGEAPDGSRYAVVDGRLVRLDSTSYKVLSVVRAIDAILD